MGRVTAIGEREYRHRRTALLEQVQPGEGAGMLWWGNHRIFYLTGFAFVPTERPIALVLDRDGRTALFVPRLEVEHAQAYAHVDRVEAYPEFPDVEHPMTYLCRLLRDMGVDGKVLGDGEGYPRIMGYWGPTLTEVAEVPFEACDELLERMMQRKSEAEVELVRESARWAARAHRLLQEYTRPGSSETEVEMRAAFEANRELLAEYGDAYRAHSWGASGPHAGYRGQIGAHSAMPHSLNRNAVFSAGDTLVTGASCPMFGYFSELERTMFLGEPSSEQERYFHHMLVLQDLAIEACRAGRSCSSVDRAVREYCQEHGLEPHWRHHTGHNIGIRYHEGPFLDVGDETVMQPGMLFTVEPGLYVEGLGGFRHSDTILVTEGDPEFLTDYPRDLRSLVLPAAR